MALANEQDGISLVHSKTHTGVDLGRTLLMALAGKCTCLVENLCVCVCVCAFCCIKTKLFQFILSVPTRNLNITHMKFH